MQHVGNHYNTGNTTAFHPMHFTPAAENTANISSGPPSTTSVLRSWRKKDASEKQSTEPISGINTENQGPVARVAPHNHYPKPSQTSSAQSADIYRYPQQYGDYSVQNVPQLPTPVKYSEIIEPMQTIEPLTPIHQKPKEKSYVEMCNVQQNHMKPYQDYQNYKQHYDGLKNYNHVSSYKQQYHSYLQKESQIPPGYVQKEANIPPPPPPHQYLHNYKMPSNYPRNYPREGNEFLANLSKIAPDMAQEIINDPHLRDTHIRDSQYPVYPPAIDQNRLYQQQHQRMYQRTSPIQHGVQNYGQRNMAQNYNQYQMNQQRIPPDPYRMYSHQRYSQVEQIPSNMSSRQYHENVMTFPRITPNYPPCGQIDYQHYQSRQVPMRQDFLPPMSNKPYMEAHPEIPDIVPEDSLHQPKKTLKAYLENWREEFTEDAEAAEAALAGDKSQLVKSTVPNRENTLYVLDAMEIPSENIPQYLHLQSIDKLPSNIRAFAYNPEENVRQNAIVISTNVKGGEKKDELVSKNKENTYQLFQKDDRGIENNIYQTGMAMNPYKNDEIRLEEDRPACKLLQSIANARNATLNDRPPIDKDTIKVNNCFQQLQQESKEICKSLPELTSDDTDELGRNDEHLENEYSKIVDSILEENSQNSKGLISQNRTDGITEKQRSENTKFDHLSHNNQATMPIHFNENDLIKSLDMVERKSVIAENTLPLHTNDSKYSGIHHTAENQQIRSTMADVTGMSKEKELGKSNSERTNTSTDHWIPQTEDLSNKTNEFTRPKDLPTLEDNPIDLSHHFEEIRREEDKEASKNNKGSVDIKANRNTFTIENDFHFNKELDILNDVNVKNISNFSNKSHLFDAEHEKEKDVIDKGRAQIDDMHEQAIRNLEKENSQEMFLETDDNNGDFEDIEKHFGSLHQNKEATVIQNKNFDENHSKNSIEKKEIFDPTDDLIDNDVVTEEEQQHDDEFQSKCDLQHAIQEMMAPSLREDEDKVEEIKNTLSDKLCAPKIKEEYDSDNNVTEENNQENKAFYSIKEEKDNLENGPRNNVCYSVENVPDLTKNSSENLAPSVENASFQAEKTNEATVRMVKDDDQDKSNIEISDIFEEEEEEEEKEDEEEEEEEEEEEDYNDDDEEEEEEEEKEEEEEDDDEEEEDEKEEEEEKEEGDDERTLDAEENLPEESRSVSEVTCSQYIHEQMIFNEDTMPLPTEDDEEIITTDEISASKQNVAEENIDDTSNTTQIEENVEETPSPIRLIKETVEETNNTIDIEENVEQTPSDINPTAKNAEQTNKTLNIEEDIEEISSDIDLAEENAEQTNNTIDIEEKVEETPSDIDLTAKNAEQTKKTLNIEEDADETSSVINLAEENGEQTNNTIHIEETFRDIHLSEENAKDTNNTTRIEVNVEETSSTIHLVERNVQETTTNDSEQQSIDLVNDESEELDADISSPLALSHEISEPEIETSTIHNHDTGVEQESEDTNNNIFEKSINQEETPNMDESDPIQNIDEPIKDSLDLNQIEDKDIEDPSSKNEENANEEEISRNTYIIARDVEVIDEQIDQITSKEIHVPNNSNTSSFVLEIAKELLQINVTENEKGEKVIAVTPLTKVKVITPAVIEEEHKVENEVIEDEETSVEENEISERITQVNKIGDLKEKDDMMICNDDNTFTEEVVNQSITSDEFSIELDDTGDVVSEEFPKESDNMENIVLEESVNTENVVSEEFPKESGNTEKVVLEEFAKESNNIENVVSKERPKESDKDKVVFDNVENIVSEGFSIESNAEKNISEEFPIESNALKIVSEEFPIESDIVEEVVSEEFLESDNTEKDVPHQSSKEYFTQSIDLTESENDRDQVDDSNQTNNPEVYSHKLDALEFSVPEVVVETEVSLDTCNEIEEVALNNESRDSVNQIEETKTIEDVLIPDITLNLDNEIIIDNKDEINEIVPLDNAQEVQEIQEMLEMQEVQEVHEVQKVQKDDVKMGKIELEKSTNNDNENQMAGPSRNSIENVKREENNRAVLSKKFKIKKINEKRDYKKIQLSALRNFRKIKITNAANNAIHQPKSALNIKKKKRIKFDLSGFEKIKNNNAEKAKIFSSIVVIDKIPEETIKNAKIVDLTHLKIETNENKDIFPKKSKHGEKRMSKKDYSNLKSLNRKKRKELKNLNVKKNSRTNKKPDPDIDNLTNTIENITLFKETQVIGSRDNSNKAKQAPSKDENTILKIAVTVQKYVDHSAKVVEEETIKIAENSKEISKVEEKPMETTVQTPKNSPLQKAPIVRETNFIMPQTNKNIDANDETTKPNLVQNSLLNLQSKSSKKSTTEANFIAPETKILPRYDQKDVENYRSSLGHHQSTKEKKLVRSQTNRISPGNIQNRNVNKIKNLIGAHPENHEKRMPPPIIPKDLRRTKSDNGFNMDNLYNLKKRRLSLEEYNNRKKMLDQSAEKKLEKRKYMLPSVSKEKEKMDEEVLKSLKAEEMHYSEESSEIKDDSTEVEKFLVRENVFNPVEVLPQKIITEFIQADITESKATELPIAQNNAEVANKENSTESNLHVENVVVTEYIENPITSKDSVVVSAINVEALPTLADTEKPKINDVNIENDENESKDAKPIEDEINKDCNPEAPIEINIFQNDVKAKELFDKSILEEKLNSLEMFLPKIAPKDTTQVEISRKLEELLAENPITYDQKHSGTLLINRLLKRETLTTEQLNKVRKIVQCKRAFQSIKKSNISPPSHPKRRYSSDFSKSIKIDFNDFDIKKVDTQTYVRREEPPPSRNRICYNRSISAFVEEQSKKNAINEFRNRNDFRFNTIRYTDDFEQQNQEDKSLKMEMSECPSKSDKIIAFPVTEQEINLDFGSKINESNKTWFEIEPKLFSNENSKNRQLSIISKSKEDEICILENQNQITKDIESIPECVENHPKDCGNIASTVEEEAVNVDETFTKEVEAVIDNTAIIENNFKNVVLNTIDENIETIDKLDKSLCLENMQMASASTVKDEKLTIHVDITKLNIKDDARLFKQNKLHEEKPQTVTKIENKSCSNQEKQLENNFVTPKANEAITKITETKDKDDLPKGKISPSESEISLKANKNTTSSKCFKYDSTNKLLSEKKHMKIFRSSIDGNIEKPSKMAKYSDNRCPEEVNKRKNQKILESSLSTKISIDREKFDKIGNLEKTILKEKKPKDNLNLEKQVNVKNTSGEKKTGKSKVEDELIFENPVDKNDKRNKTKSADKRIEKSSSSNEKIYKTPLAANSKESLQSTYENKQSHSKHKTSTKYTSHETVQTKPMSKTKAQLKSFQDSVKIDTNTHQATSSISPVISNITKITALLTYYKKSLETGTALPNLKKIEEVIHKLSPNLKNLPNLPDINIPNEFESSKSDEDKKAKSHSKKEKKKRKRFRNLYTENESDEDSSTEPNAKETKLDVKNDENEVDDVDVIDYSVYQRKSPAGVPKLVIKRRKSDFKANLQPYVKVNRVSSIESMVKKRKRSIFLNQVLFDN